MPSLGKQENGVRVYKKKKLYVKTKEKPSLCPHVATISLRYSYYLYLYLCEQRGWHPILSHVNAFLTLGNIPI